MPATVALKVGVVVISVAAAAAVAIYESPELRQFAEDCRRKIAVALHSLGDEINPASREPRFNRPEDAEGFLQSSAEAGLDGDEESRRRQREELMYWNQVRLEKVEREAKKCGEHISEQETRSQGVSFDDFLHEDQSAERGTYVYNTGAEVHEDADGLLHRRGQGLRGLKQGNFYANPFGDDNHIEMDDLQQTIDASLMSPDPSEISEDIYGMETRTPSQSSAATIGHEQEQEHLIDISEPAIAQAMANVTSQFEPDMYTSGTDAHPDAFASIHAWAESSTTQSESESHHEGFYSPLPVTPQAAMSETSEPEHVSLGQLTPTDSVSLAGSSEDVANDTSVDGEQSRYYDVMSDDEAGVSTPGSWTEVGSVVSEMDHPS